MQSAQVIETVLSCYITITPDLTATLASVAMVCAHHRRPQETCPDGCTCVLGNGLFTLPVHVLTHGRAQLLLHL